MKRFVLIIGLLGVTLAAGAQSPRFKLGKWTEIQTAILQELNRSYVDSLPIDRIERRGIDAMLQNLDPYTVYIPAEENENPGAAMSTFSPQFVKDAALSAESIAPTTIRLFSPVNDEG